MSRVNGHYVTTDQLIQIDKDAKELGTTREDAAEKLGFVQVPVDPVSEEDEPQLSMTLFAALSEDNEEVI